MHAMTTADLADRLERFRIDQEEPIKAKRLLVAAALRLRELDAALARCPEPETKALQEPGSSCHNVVGGLVTANPTPQKRTLRR